VLGEVVASHENVTWGGRSGSMSRILRSVGVHIMLVLSLSIQKEGRNGKCTEV
jgi:hypothetical protein